MSQALDAGGNASSIHREGRAARARLETAREQIAASLGATASEVIFTSGGTEAANLALRVRGIDTLVISAVEHPCVVDAAGASGLDVSVVPVTADGVIELAALADALENAKGRALVSVMLANNETGVIQPLGKVVEIARRHGAIVHTDAVQAFGKIPLNFGQLGVDLLSVASHKIGGPQGSGALVAREGIEIDPMTRGGGQELRRRPGTENVAAVAGFGAAAVAAVAELEHNEISMLRDRLESDLQNETPDVVIFGQAEKRLPNTACFASQGVLAETALITFDLEGVALSSGSACSSGKVASSPVLAAMGVAPELASGAIRASLGWDTLAGDIDRFMEIWRKLSKQDASRNAA